MVGVCPLLDEMELFFEWLAELATVEPNLKTADESGDLEGLFHKASLMNVGGRELSWRIYPES